MTISRETVYIYLFAAKNDEKEVLGAWCVLQNRRKELLSRLQQIYTASCKGIKLNVLKLDSISPQNEKMGRDLLSALFGANSSDYRSVVFTSTNNAKYAAMLSLLAVMLRGLCSQKQAVFITDPKNIRTNQLSQALRKAAFAAGTQQESFDSSPGLQIAAFLSELQLKQQPENLAALLRREFLFEKRFLYSDGDAQYLEKLVPAAQKKLYENLKDLPASLLENWARKGIGARELKNAGRLLKSGLSPQQVASLTVAKLSRQPEQILQSFQSQPSAPAADRTAWNECAQMIHTRLKESGISEEQLKDLNAAFVENEALRMADNPKKIPVRLDVWIQERGNELELLISTRRRMMQEALQQDTELEPSAYSLSVFSGPGFDSRLNDALDFLSQCGLPLFFHIQPYMEREVKKQLLLRNWRVPYVLESVGFQLEPGTLRLPEERIQPLTWMNPQILERLTQEEIRCLSMPELSASLTRLLTAAFSHGLNPSVVENAGLELEAHQLQEKLRSLAGHYVFSRSQEKWMEEVLLETHDLDLWDFLSHPALSKPRREIIYAAWKKGIPLEQIRRLIHVRMTRAAMERRLSTPEKLNRKKMLDSIHFPQDIQSRLKAEIVHSLNTASEMNHQNNVEIKAEILIHALEDSLIDQICSSLKIII